MIDKIISGGQTGADIGGLKAAKKKGIKTGGTAPKGFKTERGFNPDLGKIFGLRESASSDYAVRTEANINGSHATVIFASRPDSRGTQLTVKLCQQKNKPSMLINPFDLDAEIELKVFIDEIYAKYRRELILNIAGNRESKSPGIENKVEELIMKILS